MILRFTTASHHRDSAGKLGRSFSLPLSLSLSLFLSLSLSLSLSGTYRCHYEDISSSYPSCCSTNDETFASTEGPVGGPPVYLELSQAPVQSACRRVREVDKEIEKGHREDRRGGARRSHAGKHRACTADKNDNFRWNMQLRLQTHAAGTSLATCIPFFHISSQLLLHLPFAGFLQPPLRSFSIARARHVSLWDLSSRERKSAIIGWL